MGNQNNLEKFMKLYEQNGDYGFDNLIDNYVINPEELEYKYEKHNDDYMLDCLPSDQLNETLAILSLSDIDDDPEIVEAVSNFLGNPDTDETTIITAIAIAKYYRHCFDKKVAIKNGDDIQYDPESIVAIIYHIVSQYENKEKGPRMK